MLQFIIMYLIFTSIFGNAAEGRRTLRNFFDVLIVFFMIQFIFRLGFSLLPLLIIGALCTRIVFPFLAGFFSSFRS